LDAACHIGSDGQLHQFSWLPQSRFSDQFLQLFLLLIIPPLMNAFSDIGEILTSFLDSLPWPALLLSEQGEVTFINKQLRQRKSIQGVTSDTRLERLFPEYYGALQSTHPWLVTQDADLVNSQTGAHEQLCLRRLPLGACLIVAEHPQARGFDLGSAQTARLASLGFMVAGVCHEVANPLTAIHSMVQLLQSSTPLAPETLKRGLENIASNVRRLLNISKKLNDFSRSGTEDASLLHLDQPLAEALQNARQDAQFRDIEVEHQAAPELWVMGNGDQLEQVFANIFLNAAQAMNGQGMLRVTSHKPNPLQVEVTIHDSGPGIAPGHLARLFEPFFTTKPTGQGTGLGLAICNEIIIEHGGSVRAENHPQGGACFLVTLPLHQYRS
jgi:signal transduction histidine kinase